MSFVEVGQVSVTCKCSDMRDALNIWCIKPHVVNRRLAGCTYVLDTKFVFVPDMFRGTLDRISKSVSDAINSTHSLDDRRKVDLMLNDPDVDQFNYTQTTDMNISCCQKHDNSHCRGHHDSSYQVCKKEETCSECTNVGQYSKSQTSETEIFKNQVETMFYECFGNGTNYDKEVNCILRKLIPRNLSRYRATYELIFIHAGMLCHIALFYISARACYYSCKYT